MYDQSVTHKNIDKQKQTHTQNSVHESLILQTLKMVCEREITRKRKANQRVCL